MLIQAKIYTQLIGDEKKSKEIYEFLFKKYPHFIEAYHSYWRSLLQKGDKKLLSKISQMSLDASDHSSVPTS